MSYPAYIREKARELRTKKKLTIDELAERLAVPRTTVYYWVKDLPLPASMKPVGFSEAARRKGNRAMKRKYRLLPEAAYDDALLFYSHLSELPTFRDFLVIFMTEGHRRSRHDVSVANSDPSIIRLSDRWMRQLSANGVRYSVQYHADQDLDELRKFWSEELGVDTGAIKLQRKSNSGRLSGRTWRSRYGVLTVTAQDTYFREAMRAWTDCLRECWLHSGQFGA
jgi:hypothetical protein